MMLAPTNAEINVIAPYDRETDVWKGAAMFASLSTFNSNQITKEDYQEYGAKIVQRLTTDGPSQVSSLRP